MANSIRREVTLPNGAKAHFELSSSADGYTDVASSDLSFSGVLDAVEGVALALGETMKKLKPKSATVEFGVELGLKEGKLLAIFLQGEGKANLKVQLTWGET